MPVVDNSMFGLDPIFVPRSIVLIDGVGTPDSVADSVWKTISASFSRGAIVRINAAGDNPALAATAAQPNTDLAVIIAPPDQQLDFACACDTVGIKGALLISPDRREPGYGDLTDPYVNIQEKCTRGLRIIGPQSFGIMNPHHDLNITAGLPGARPGNIAFISQSGAICSAVLDWSFRTGVGFSSILSCDLMLDVGWSELISHFGDDPYTKSIVINMESPGDARSFLSAAREVALNKPIIVLKAGRTKRGAAVAASHSHSGDGADQVFDAALQRVGVLRVRSISEMFYMANILASQPLPRGPRLTIITNSIGPAVMATDTLLTSGGKLARISADTASRIQELVQHPSCCDNPIDILGDADADRYAEALQIVASEKESDGTLVILTPQSRTQPTQTARQIVASTARTGKPVLASWMGADRVAEGQEILFEAGIPTFSYPDTPARLFALMWRHAQNLNGIYETPAVIVDEDKLPIDSASARLMLDGVRGSGRTDLTEWESKAVLKSYGISVVETVPAATEEEAVTAAGIIGYPVVVKLHSHSGNLKHHIHGPHLNLRNDQDVRDSFRAIRKNLEVAGKAASFLGVTVQRMITRRGYALVAGSRLDRQFGPYMYFGTSGPMTDVLKDYALGLPPLTSALADRMMERTRAWKVLQDSGYSRTSLVQLQGILVRLSQLIIQQPAVSGLEINPLLLTPDSVLVLDAQISVHAATSNDKDLPRPAIRPYPTQYTWKEHARNGIPVLIRPVRPEDEPLIVEFHKKLSEETIYRRYFFQHKLSRRTSHERLRRTCFLDFDREIALAAIIDHPEDEHCVSGVGRLARNRTGESAEVALVVADPYQSHGIGTFLLTHLVDIARSEGITSVEGTMLRDNIHMQHLFSKLGFSVGPGADDTVQARLVLT